jgi:hypothetical protein
MRPESLKQLKHAIETVERAGYQHRLGLLSDVSDTLAQLAGELHWIVGNETKSE